MAVQAFSGTLTVLMNGAQYSIQGNWKIQPNQWKYTRKMGADGSDLGYIQEPQVCYVEGELADSGALSVQALMNATGVTITANQVNGKVYTLVNASWGGESTIDAHEGKVTVRFETGTCTERVAAS